MALSETNNKNRIEIMVHEINKHFTVFVYKMDCN